MNLKERTKNLSEFDRNFILNNPLGATVWLINQKRDYIFRLMDEIQELNAEEHRAQSPAAHQNRIAKKLDLVDRNEDELAALNTCLVALKGDYKKLVGEEWKPKTKSAPAGDIEKRMEAKLAAYGNK